MTNTQSLIVLSLLSLVKSSTTARSPNLLLVILLFLEHLSALTRILLNAKLDMTHLFRIRYSSKTVLCLKLLDVIQAVIDESKTS